MRGNPNHCVKTELSLQEPKKTKTPIQAKSKEVVDDDDTKSKTTSSTTRTQINSVKQHE